MNSEALAQAWQQVRTQWHANARLRAGLWMVLGLGLVQLLWMGLDRVDARRAALDSLRAEAHRLRNVPSAQAWGERADQASQAVAAYAGMAWSEADVNLSEAALQDWLRTVSGRLGLPVRELTVARAQVSKSEDASVTSTGKVSPLPPGHVLLRARLVAELQRTPLLAFLAECARHERSIVVDRLVWRGAGQPLLVEMELHALAQDGTAVPQPGGRP